MKTAERHRGRTHSGMSTLSCLSHGKERQGMAENVACSQPPHESNNTATLLCRQVFSN